MQVTLLHTHTHGANAEILVVLAEGQEMKLMYVMSDMRYSLNRQENNFKNKK